MVEKKRPFSPFEATLVLIVALSAFSINVTVPGIPDANVALGGGIKDGHYITAAYLLGYCAGHIPFGILGDRFGRRSVMLGGLTLFLVGGFLTSIAWSIEVMLAARFIQGFGGAVGPVLARAIARDVSVGRELSRLLAVFVSVLATMPLVAPLVGGALLPVFGWRGTFEISVVLTAFALICTLLFIHETRPEEVSEQPFIENLRSGLASFFNNRDTLWGGLMIGFIFLGYLAIISSVAPILSDTYGFDGSRIAFVTALLLLPYTVTAFVNRNLAKQHSSYIILRYSMIFYAASSLVTAVLLSMSKVSLYGLSLALVLFLIAMGLSFSHATVVAMAKQGGAAGLSAGLLGTLQMFAGFLGGALAATFYDKTPSSLLFVILIATVGLLVTYLIRKEKGI